MSSFLLYLMFGLLLLLIRWIGDILQTPSFLKGTAGAIAFLLLVAVLVTWPQMKKQWRKRTKKPFIKGRGLTNDKENV